MPEKNMKEQMEQLRRQVIQRIRQSVLQQRQKLTVAETGDLIDEVVKALLAAGVIGVFIARQATFSAEIGGCQAECGSASGMSAAGLVTLAGGRLDQAILRKLQRRST